MALLDSEIARIRAELGYNVMGVNAEPYIGVVSIFNSVIQQYLTAGAKTTSATPVTAADEPTPQTLALLSGEGFSDGDIIVVDHDGRQERATVSVASGNNVTALLTLAHTGTYPVTVEGGESIVRELLRELQTISLGTGSGSAGAMSKVKSRLGLKKVDDVEFFGGGGAQSAGKDPWTQLKSMREYWRDELANALGVVRLNGRGGGGQTSVY